MTLPHALNPLGLSGLVAVYTITFNPNGGFVYPTTMQTGIDGKLTSFPVVDRSGYDFVGWVLNLDDEIPITLVHVFTSNTTLFAKWKAVSGLSFYVEGTPLRRYDVLGFQLQWDFYAISDYAIMTLVFTEERDPTADYSADIDVQLWSDDYLRLSRGSAASGYAYYITIWWEEEDGHPILHVDIESTSNWDVEPILVKLEFFD